MGRIQRRCGLLSQPLHGNIFSDTVLCVIWLETDITRLTSSCFVGVNEFTFKMRWTWILKRLVTGSSGFKLIRLGYAVLTNNQKRTVALIWFIYFLVTFACSVLCSGKHEFLMDERRSRRIGQSPCFLETHWGELAYSVRCGEGEASKRCVEEVINTWLSTEESWEQLRGKGIRQTHRSSNGHKA